MQSLLLPVHGTSQASRTLPFPCPHRQMGRWCCTQPQLYRKGWPQFLHPERGNKEHFPVYWNYLGIGTAVARQGGSSQIHDLITESLLMQGWLWDKRSPEPQAGLKEVSLRRTQSQAHPKNPAWQGWAGRGKWEHITLKKPQWKVAVGYPWGQPAALDISLLQRSVCSV